MIHIRQWLTREWASLLSELGARDARTLLRRALFYIWLYGSTGIVLGGLYAVYLLFGMAAFVLAAAGVILFSMWVIVCTGGGSGADPEMYEWMGPRRFESCFLGDAYRSRHQIYRCRAHQQ